jgi:PAS domain S-box-containing protein
MREDVYQSQGLAITVAVLVPLVANAVSISGIFDIPNLTPAGLGVTGLALLWGMRSYGIGEVAPVARENVVQSLQSGILVVDTANAVSEINDRTKEMFHIDEDDVIGMEFEEVFSHLPTFNERYADIEEVTDEIQVEMDGPRTYEVQVSSVADQNGKRVGRLFMFHDVTERKRRERELQLQNKQLDQFASLVSHEIQSPLADVRQRVDSSLEHVRAENRGDLLQARRSLEDVDELVDDILSMTSQGGAVGPEDANRVSLATAADGAWWDVTQRELPATMNAEDFEVLADPDRLERILVNLFENAVKYGGEDVIVDVGLIDDEVTGEQGFYVEDDGPGLPENARHAVFDAGVSGSDGSPGLGLAIVETMAEAHDWEVRVTDGKMGGARFEFVDVDLPTQHAPRSETVVGRASDD